MLRDSHQGDTEPQRTATDPHTHRFYIVHSRESQRIEKRDLNCRRRGASTVHKNSVAVAPRRADSRQSVLGKILSVQSAGVFCPNCYREGESPTQTQRRTRTAATNPFPSPPPPSLRTERQITKPVGFGFKEQLYLPRTEPPSPLLGWWGPETPVQTD